MLAWHCVVSSPQQEIRASIEIAKSGFDVFFPIKRYERRTLNRPPQIITGPLFPRYLFVRFDRLLPDWTKIRDMRGVSDILTNSNQPIIVRDDIVEAIRTYKEPERVVEGDKAFIPEQRVRIVNGPLSGIEGLFKGSDRQRTKAFLEILGKRWEIPFSTIEAA